MEPIPAPIDPARLLEHAGWLRRLALRLVRDEAAADDVVQETWLRALERPPSEPPASRGWLARVARNVVYEGWRRRAARRRREERASRAEAVEPADAVVDRAEVQHRLLAAVLALEEPFRTAMLLRWFDELSPGEIAERTGVPVATVRTRLWRATSRLRERLDREHGGSRRAWALALVPLARDAGARAAAGSVAVGVLAMASTPKIAVVAFAAVLAAIGAWALLPSGAPDARPPSRDATGAPGVDSRDVATLRGDGKAERAEDRPDDARPGRAGVAGTVSTAQGRPVAGARVRVTLHDLGDLVREVAVGETGADGRFAFAGTLLEGLDGDDPLLRATGRLEVGATADGFVPSPEDTRRLDLRSLRAGEPVEVALVLEPGHVAHGVVLGRRGVPVRASVTMRPLGRDPSGAPTHAATDRDGRYRIPIRAAGPHRFTAELVGEGAGEAGPLDLDPGSDREVPPIRLGGAGYLAGTARFPDGSPAPGAPISCRRTSHATAGAEGLGRGHDRTDDGGRFRIEGLLPGDYHVFFGEPRGEPPPAHATGTTDIEVVVPAHHVRARVVDAQGRAVAGLPVGARWVHPSEEGAEDARNVDFASGTPADADGTVDWWAARGDVLQLSVSFEGIATAEAEVRIEERPWSQDVTLRVEPAPTGEPARLRVRLRSPDGDLVPAEVTVETPLARQAHVYRHETPPDGTIDVPAGEWRVTAAAATRKGPPIDFLFPEERLVRLEPGEEEVLDATARPAGRLRLTVRGVGEDRWDAADPSLLATPLAGGPPARIRAFVTVSDSGWRMGSLHPPSPGISLTRLVPGRHAIRFEAAGFAPIETEVDVPAGGLADLVLEPKPAVPRRPLADTVLPRVEWRGESLEGLVGHLAKETDRELRITDAARPRLAGAPGHGSFQGRSVATLLTSLLEPQDLVWKEVDGALWVGTRGETP